MRNTLLGLSLLFGGGTVAAFQQTVIPCGVDGNTTSSCTITAPTQLVTLSQSTGTTTATITSSLAARRVNRVVVPAYKEKYVVAPFQDLGPLAIRDYDGSGLCNKCDPPNNDQYVQTVTINECSSNARQSTKVCRQYKETWSRTAQGAAAPCTLTATTRYPAPTGGAYTFTFTGTAPPTYTVIPPSIQTITGRNGRLTYKVIKPKTVWYQPQPYNVALTTIINNGGIINIQTTITTVVSVFLPTTTVTATQTVTFTNTTSGQVSTTTAGQTSTSSIATTSATTTQGTVPTGTPSRFYLQASFPNSNDVYYVRFVNNQAQLVTLVDALANGADTFNLTYGFLQNLGTAQTGGLGAPGTFLVGTSNIGSTNDDTTPVAQFNGFPSGAYQFLLSSLPAGSVPATDSNGSPFPISGLTLSGAQNFCANSQNNLLAVFGIRSGSCARVVNLTTVPRIRSPSTSTSTTGPTSSVSGSSTTSGPSSTASPRRNFYLRAQNPDGTTRYVQFQGPYAYLISPVAALGGDNAPADAAPLADLFDYDIDGALRTYGAYVGTPNTNNGAPLQRYNSRPTNPSAFTLNPDGSVVLNGATSFCATPNGQLLTNYGNTQSNSCRDTVTLAAANNVTPASSSTTTSGSGTSTASNTATGPTTSGSNGASTTGNSNGSTTSGANGSATSGANGSSTSGANGSTTSGGANGSSTSGNNASPTTSGSATTTSPGSFYLLARNLRGGPSKYIQYRGQNAYLISPVEALAGTDGTTGVAPVADLFSYNPLDGTLRNGQNPSYYVGTASNTTGTPVSRFTSPGTGPSTFTRNTDGTVTLNNALSLCGDANNELLANFGTVSPSCQDEYLISPVTAVSLNPDAVTSGVTSIGGSTTGIGSLTTGVSSLTSSLSSGVGSATSGIGSLTSSLTSGVGSATSGLGSLTSSLTSGIGSATSGLSSLTTGLTSATSGLSSGVGSLTSGASSLTTGVSSVTSGLTSSIGSLTSGIATTTGAFPFPTGVIPGQPFYLGAVNPLTGTVRYIKFIGDQATLVDTNEALLGNTGTGGVLGADLFTLLAPGSSITSSIIAATTSLGLPSTSGSSISGTLLNGVIPVGADGITDGSRIKRFPLSTTTQGIWTLAPNGTLSLAGAQSLYLDTASELLANFNTAAPDCATFVLQAIYTIPTTTPPASTGTLCPATVPPTSSTSGIGLPTTSGSIITTGLSTTGVIGTGSTTVIGGTTVTIPTSGIIGSTTVTGGTTVTLPTSSILGSTTVIGGTTVTLPTTGVIGTGSTTVIGGTTVTIPTSSVVVGSTTIISGTTVVVPTTGLPTSATSVIGSLTSSLVSTTSGAIPVSTPFYISVVNPTTGVRQYLRRRGNALVAVDPTTDTGPMTEYLVDALGFLEAVDPVGTVPNTTDGTTPGLPYYVAVAGKTGSQPLIAQQTIPTQDMKFTIGPDLGVSMNGVQSFCTDAGSSIIANFAATQGSTCQQTVQLVAATSMLLPTTSVTVSLPSTSVTVSLPTTSVTVSLPTTSVTVSLPSTSVVGTTISGISTSVTVSLSTSLPIGGTTTSPTPVCATPVPAQTNSCGATGQAFVMQLSGVSTCEYISDARSGNDAQLVLSTNPADAETFYLQSNGQIASCQTGSNTIYYVNINQITGLLASPAYLNSQTSLSGTLIPGISTPLDRQTITGVVGGALGNGGNLFLPKVNGIGLQPSVGTTGIGGILGGGAANGLGLTIDPLGGLNIDGSVGTGGVGVGVGTGGTGGTGVNGSIGTGGISAGINLNGGRPYLVGFFGGGSGSTGTTTGLSGTCSVGGCTTTITLPAVTTTVTISGGGIGIGLPTTSIGIGIGLPTTSIGIGINLPTTSIGIGLPTTSIGIGIGLPTTSIGIGIGLPTTSIGVGVGVTTSFNLGLPLPSNYVAVTAVYRGSGTVSPEPSTSTVVTAGLLNRGTVSIFYNPRTVTITSSTAGLSTSTSVIASQVGPTPGTVEVFVPNYDFTTTTSGTVGVTRVITSASGAVRGSGLVVIPTPDLSCGNRGLQYAIQSNPFTRGLVGADPTYSAFNVRPFQTEAPQATGVVNYLEVPFISRDSSGQIYGNPVGLGANDLGVNHRGYLFAKETGTYSFQFIYSDDISLLWLGANALAPIYSRANANIVQLYNPNVPIAEQKITYNVTLIQGTYTPIRVLYANSKYDAEFLLQIYAPDGTLITNGAQTSSPYLVQYSCDGIVAPMFVQRFGQEGTAIRIRGGRR